MKGSTAFALVRKGIFHTNEIIGVYKTKSKAIFVYKYLSRTNIRVSDIYIKQIETRGYQNDQYVCSDQSILHQKSTIGRRIRSQSCDF